MAPAQRRLTFNINHYNETIIGGTYQIPLMRFLKKERSWKWTNLCNEGINDNNDTIYDYSSNDKNSKINNLIKEIFFLDNKYEMSKFFNECKYSYSPKTFLIPHPSFLKDISINNKTFFLKSGDYSVYGNEEPLDKMEGHSGKGVFVIKENNFQWIRSKMKKNKKYILQEGVENILLNEDRKFDIRTHVLFLKIGNRLKMYMWKNSYLRICADKYNPNSLDNSIHLTNVHRQHFKDDFDFKKNQKLLSDLPQYDAINNNIKEVCKDLFVKILKDVKFNNDEKPSFWITGFDFIIDNNLKPWLLEINHNPGFVGEQNIRKYNEINYRSMIDFADNILEKILRNQTINDSKTGGWNHIFSAIIPDINPTKNYFTPSFEEQK